MDENQGWEKNQGWGLVNLYIPPVESYCGPNSLAKVVQIYEYFLIPGPEMHGGSRHHLLFEMTGAIK